MIFYSLNYKVNGVVDTPTSINSNLFKFFGHSVFNYNGFYSDPIPDKIDWVMSLHEDPQYMVNAYSISKSRKSKLYCHVEFLIPWRLKINYGSYKWDEWGYEDREFSQEYCDYFKSLKYVWDSCELRTCASKYYIEPIQEFFESSKKIFVKYPGTDSILASLAHKKDFKDREFDIVTISRLVPYKKVDIIARSLVKYNKNIKWVLIGYGPELPKIQNIINGSKVQLFYFNKLDGIEKLNVIGNSKIGIHCWNGLPPVECALMNCYPIVRNDFLMEEYFSPYINMFDDEIDLVTKIGQLLSSPNDTYDAAINIGKNIQENKYTMGTSIDEARKILAMMEIS
jgi:glycosyltransferase involved in cell wall biosynthesis